MFLDFAEDQARRKKEIFLKEWQNRLDDFLRFNDRNILPDAGRISRDAANEKAEHEFEKFAKRRREHAEAEGLKELEDLAKASQNKAGTSGK